MFNPFKDYFYYTKSERNGTIGLLLLSVFLFTLPTTYAFIFPIDRSEYISYQKEIPDLAAHFVDESATTSTEIKLFHFDPNRATASELLQLGLANNTAKAIVNYRSKGGKFYQASDLQKIYTLSEADYQRLKDYIKIPPRQQRKIAKADTSGLEIPQEYNTESPRLFLFDPNTTAANTLRKLGLSQDVVNNILRYRAKGGKFYSAKSLKKIYGLSQGDYERIAPYVQIATPTVAIDSSKASKPNNYSNNYVRKNPRAIIDVNRATAEEWQQLRGIGAYYAKRIVNFRDYLGGFYSIDQVGETYGLKPETFTQIRRQLKLSPVVRKININTAEMEVMSKHPYLNWQQAQTIYNYRIQHGNYQAVEDLLETQVVTEEDLRRLRPYLMLSKE